MCGRYTLAKSLGDLQLRFAFDSGPIEWRPRYNLAPTQESMVVTSDGERRVAARYRWGLIPTWAKAEDQVKNTINARSETITTSGLWRRLLPHQRCLILADGFYEWKRGGSEKTPMHIRLRSGEAFAFAGVWDAWQAPTREVVKSTAIITTAANELMADIHNRMPLILPRELEEAWLDPEMTDAGALTDLLKPYPADLMTAYPVSKMVGNVKNDRPGLVIPFTDAETRLV